MGGPGVEPEPREQSAGSPHFDIGRVFLKKECEDAHALALKTLGGITYVNQADFEFMPPEEPDVLYNSDYYKQWQEDHKSTKLQK